jgi:hypothetical protein
MKMKIFSLFVIAIMALSAVNIVNVSAYSHGDVRADQIGYISTYGGYQYLCYTNDPDLSWDSIGGWDTFPTNISFGVIEQTDNWARVFFDTNWNYRDIYKAQVPWQRGYRINWSPLFNSKHTFRFYLDIQGWSGTNGWRIDNVDYSKGILVVSDSKNRAQWADVFYTDTSGNKLKSYFEYKP